MLKQGNCVKRIDDTTTESLQADAGESFLIKAIYDIPVSGNDYLVLKVDRKTVGAYRVLGKAGNHLGHIQGDFIHKNLMEFMTGKGINCSIPVAEGQTFTVSDTGNTSVVVIVYDIYDAADIRADMPNGTESKEYMFMQYMASSETVDAAGTITLDISLSPAEFPDFPCGKSVPANATIEILGLVGAPVGNSAPYNTYTESRYVKMIKEREVLFDEDRNGIPFWNKADLSGDLSYSADFSLIGPCVSQSLIISGSGNKDVGTVGDPLIFTPALSFRSGEELLVNMTFVWADGHDLTGSDIDLAAIMKVTMS